MIANISTITTPDADIQLLADDKRAYDQVMNIVHQAPNSDALLQSLSVRLAKESGVSAYGKRAYDTLGAEPGKEPDHLDMSPYDRMGAGATVAVTATDPTTHEVYLLLGRKYVDSKHPELGLGDWILPGGYVKAKPPAGASAQDMADYDQNLHETAARELFEETGYELPASYHMKSLGVNSDVTGNKDLHTVNEFFHAHVPQNPSEFSPPVASDDLAAAQWVRASDIIKNDSLDAQPDGSKQSRYSVKDSQGNSVIIRDLHGEYIEKAVAATRAETLKLYAHRLNALGITAATGEMEVGENAHAHFAAIMDRVSATPSQNQWQKLVTQGQKSPVQAATR